MPQICIPLQVFCNPGWYWFYRHISCWPAPHLHLLANSLHLAGTGSTKHISCRPAPHICLLILFTPAGTGSTNTSHVGLPPICICLLILCTPGWYGFYRHISCQPAPHLHPLAGFLHPRLVLVVQRHLMLACPTFASPCWFCATPSGTGSTKHISCWPAPTFTSACQFFAPGWYWIYKTHLMSACPTFASPCWFFAPPAGTGSTKHISCWPAPHLHPLANSLYPRPVWVLQTHLMSACPTFVPPAGTGSTNTSHVALPPICICLLILCTWPVWVLQTHLMLACPTFASPCWFLAPQAGTGCTKTSHAGLPTLASPCWFFAPLASTDSTKHISCWPAPHLHPLANSLYPQPVWVLQTHLMSACPKFASPCWFFAPPAGTGSTNTSHVGLHHICISLPIFCTPGQCGFYKHIPNRPEPHLHSLAMPAGTSSMDS